MFLISYVYFVLRFPIIYYILTIIIGVAIWIWKKKLSISLLAAYCFMLYAMAVLHRPVTPDATYRLQLFWSWREWDRLGLQIIANILVFIPIGYLAGCMWKRKGLIFGVSFSVLIELSQLILHRGMFEFDDIVHNGVGALIGIALCHMVVKDMTRFFDIVFSFIAIVILLPFMIPIMIGLKLTGEHDIFYGQERIGKGGKPFKLWKFATMLRNSPNMAGGTYTSKDDPRILPMGKFLRKTKINELPQLINILSGEMSIIGYRPLVPRGYAMYPEEVKRELAKGRPGLSGIGSIVFRNEEQIVQNFANYEDKDEFYRTVIMPYKGQVEVWYTKHRNVFMYFRLIFMTAEAVLNPKSSSWKKLRGIPEVPEKLSSFL